MTACQLCAAVTGPDPHSSELGRLLRPGQHPQIATNPHAAAIPTIGAFTTGYLLIVPRRHTLSLGALPAPDLAGVGELADAMITHLRDVYRRPILGFEYGLNVPGARRIAHAHLHLLPSDAALAPWLHDRLPGYVIPELTQLPNDPSRSYIAVWDQNGTITAHPVANDASPRLRLRQITAHLDPALPEEAWDWQNHAHRDLIRRTVDDLQASTVRLREPAAGAPA